MKIKFWGTRGSIPAPGKDTVRYGGNTSCVSVEGEHSENNMIILDGGSGIRELGLELLKTKQFTSEGVRPLELFIFFSHVHWDHIQGIPFFKPLFIPGNKIHMHGEHKARTSLSETLKGQQQFPNFPISIDEISINGAELDFNDLVSGQSVFANPNIKVSMEKLSHPDGVLAYKVVEGHPDPVDKSVVYATDTEHRNVLDPRLLKFAKGVDVLIYDSQYTPEEYIGKGEKTGMVPKFDWGHSTYEFAVDTAIEAGVKELVLFHHDPEHTDDDIDKIVERAIDYRNGKGNMVLKIRAAAEGDCIEL